MGFFKVQRFFEDPWGLICNATANQPKFNEICFGNHSTDGSYRVKSDVSLAPDTTTLNDEKTFSNLCCKAVDIRKTKEIWPG